MRLIFLFKSGCSKPYGVESLRFLRSLEGQQDCINRSTTGFAFQTKITTHFLMILNFL